MKELESELIPLQQVIELEENSKDHDLGSINTSIDRFGFLERIIINKITGHLIAGHGRVRTLQQMKVDGADSPKGIEVLDGEWLVPADYVEVKKKDEVAASIALNRLVELGGWDEPKLVDNLISIAGKDGKGLVGTGFDGDELDALIRMHRPELIETPDDPGAQLDKAEELQKKWGVKQGDIFEIGAHRIMCGDSTSKDDVERLMAGQLADFTFIDPPYGQAYSSNMRTKTKKFDVIEGDDQIDFSFISIAERYSSSWILVCTSWKVLCEWRVGLSEFGKLNNMIIWDKGGGGMGDLPHSLLTDYEIILAFGRGSEISGKRIGSVWDIQKDNPNMYLHPTQKPSELIVLAMQTFGCNIALDLFLGSGSTMVAAEQSGHSCFGIDIEPKYCAVTLERMSGMGLEPKLVHG